VLSSTAINALIESLIALAFLCLSSSSFFFYSSNFHFYSISSHLFIAAAVCLDVVAGLILAFIAAYLAFSATNFQNTS